MHTPAPGFLEDRSHHRLGSGTSRADTGGMDGESSLRQVAPDRLQVREGGGGLSFFGIPFFAAGVFLLLAVGGVVPFENADEVPGHVSWILLVMGLAFASVGGGLVFGRKWVTLDRARGKIRKEWGLLVPARSRELPLESYEAVLLTFDSGDSDSSDRYPVLLKGFGETQDLPLTSHVQYGEAREQAGELARFLSLPLVDRSTAHESVTAPDQVNLSFRDRIQSHLEAEGEEWEESQCFRSDEAPVGPGGPAWDEPPWRADGFPQATRPRELVCRVRELGDGVEIDRPGPPVRLDKVLAFVIPAGLLAYSAPDLLQFFQATRTPEGIQVSIFAFLAFLFVAVPFGGLILAALHSFRGGSVLTVSSEEIVLEERGAVKRSVRRLPVGDLLGVDWGTRAGVLVSVRRGAASGARRAPGSRPVSASTPGPGRPGREPWWVSALRRLVPSQGIVLKTREDLVAFGAGLPDDEVAYLHSLVRRALSAS